MNKTFSKLVIIGSFALLASGCTTQSADTNAPKIERHDINLGNQPESNQVKIPNYTNTGLGIAFDVPNSWYIDPTKYFYQTKNLGVNIRSSENRKTPYTDIIISQDTNPSVCKNDDSYENFELPNNIKGVRQLTGSSVQKIQHLCISHNKTNLFIDMIINYDYDSLGGKLMNNSNIYTNYSEKELEPLNTILSTLQFDK